jgi:hypothetical protein
MIFAEIAVLALIGGTTWLTQDWGITRRRGLNRRLTAVGLGLCLAALVAVAVVAALFTRS